MTSHDKDEMRVSVIVALMMAGVLVLILLCAEAFSHPPGTILVSRNADERQNRTPGVWNHLAIITGDAVVESQQCEGVIKTPLAEYLARDYSKILALTPRDEAAGARAARRALALVGVPERRLSSLLVFHGLRRERLGLNCVTAAVEIPWAGEFLGARLIVLPDGFLRIAPRAFNPPEVVR